MLDTFMVPPSFRMECSERVGLPWRGRSKTEYYLKTFEESGMSETWAVSIELRKRLFSHSVEPEHKNYLHYAYNSSVQDLSISIRPHYGPQDVYAGSVDNRDLPQGAGSIYAQVSRRLVTKEQDDPGGRRTPHPGPILGYQAGLPDQQEVSAAFLGSTLDLKCKLDFPSNRWFTRRHSKQGFGVVVKSRQPDDGPPILPAGTDNVNSDRCLQRLGGLR